MATAMYDSLVREYTENYLQKVYYFCLKKTGSTTEAEDLSGDITLNILTSLSRGSVPASFSAWVWQVARNRYSVWADKKHKRTDSVTGTDIGDYEIEDGGEDLANALIRREELAALRRELAFTAAEYRTIVVAYYLEDKPIREIAATLSLSESTVKQRLFRARKILKEGMNMAREFGVRSYKPEEVAFTNSCSSFGDKGQPWNVLTHALYKNIFLEAYGNPSTAEELSVELGVALPYMEDELEYLTRETFLKKEGSKYETAFPIISRDAQVKVRYKNVQYVKTITTLLEKMVDTYYAATCRKVNAAFDRPSYEDAKWTLLLCMFERLCYDSDNRRVVYTTRPDNGQWDIVGFQTTDFPAPTGIGLHGCNGNVRFSQFRIYYKDMDKKTPDYLTKEESEALLAVAKGETASEEMCERLVDYGYISRTEDDYEPAMMVFGRESEDISDFTEKEKQILTESADQIRRLIKEAKAYTNEVTAKDLPPIFQNDSRLVHFACVNNYLDRGFVLDQALEDGWLKYDENTSPVVGAYLYVD
ncbi:MAG: RNA polymerase sigma factor [Clostridia bacterium]|nr:RNA polymerase sigma factor [Clostridia bacterium]